MKPKGYNRNVYGGKRPHRGISSMPENCINNIVNRIEWESYRMQQYIDRVYKNTKQTKRKGYCISVMNKVENAKTH